jgi:DNA helicase-2/ATP-dependent DNA helicase PcrA
VSRRTPADDTGQLGFDLGELPVVPARSRPRPGAATPDAGPGSVSGPVAVPGSVRAPEAGRRLLDAAQIARTLGRPEPTPEQARVIEADVAPLLVVAGAGSGKTETMAARVVWLVANGLVDAQDVLGLTFTRKAAGELADRVRSRLRALYRHGLCPSEPPPVTVSTYHAYAASIVRDHGLRFGVEPGSRLLTEAGAWQLAADLVQHWDGDMSGVDYKEATVTAAVLALAGECAEHLVDPAEVTAFAEGVLERILQLPKAVGDGFPGAPSARVRELAGKLAAKGRLVPLVEAYLDRKRRLEVLDFGDQVATAARIAEQAPEVATGERARYRVVLLDEYQDTSHGQLVLLRALFGDGHPVTAVGDPHQSIYGWRGASAGNLQRFPADFPWADGSPAPVGYLSTTWRNDTAVLAVANAVAGPLRHPADPLPAPASVDVPPLAPRPAAGSGAVTVQWHTTVEDEAHAVAEHVERHWRGTGTGTGTGTEAGPGTGSTGSSSGPGSTGPGSTGTEGPPRTAAPPTVAVLCRARSQFPLLEARMRARGLPVEVVGLGGLLSVPEVADLRAALEVVDDPSRGDSLMRLLTGAAWRLGASDLEALGVWSAELLARSGLSAARRAPSAVTADADAVDEGSIVEAIDELPAPGWRGPSGQELSQVARRRLHRLAALLHGLRSRTGLPLPDLVLEVERALLLDVEVAALPGVRPAAARAHLDAFVEVAAGFAEAGDRGGLGAFLSWLAAADDRERGLEMPVTQVRTDAVQILTVHAAKGLEWDVVAVTGLVEGTFPSIRSRSDESNAWLGELGALPYPLRGDARGLPSWRVDAVASQAELTRETDDFRARCGAHEVAEERRLAYVAVTRARHHLLLTGAVWGDGSTARGASRFLQEVADLDRHVTGLRVDCWSATPEDGAENPREALTRQAHWPVDPLGDRRPHVEAGAALVLAAVARRPGPPAAQDAAAREATAWEATAWEDVAGEDDAVAEQDLPWRREVDLLLAERAAARRRVLDVELPAHLSASRLVALAADPVELAHRLRRPMPQPPSAHARRGSAFHAWLEQRFGAAALVDVDELPGAADDAAGDEELVRLQSAFLASEWADRIPEAVEVALETPVAGLVLRARVDAVFAVAGPGGRRWDVVDWKTGAPPSDPHQAAARAVQLAVYRLAWARLNGVGVDRVGAAFFYASTGRTVRPVDLLDETGLERLIADATTPVSAPVSAPAST